MIKFNNAAVALATTILRDYLSGAANFSLLGKSQNRS